jgi:radical SAM protein with 4Fe4S-binding SPASM domain
MIGPQGELYHCWEDFGNPKLAVGNVKTGRSENLEYIQQYYDFDPTTHPKCSTCTVMPLCMGGCPKRRLLHNEPHCGVYKFNLDQHVIKTFQALPPLDNNQITDTAQMKELATIPLLQAQFHEPYPNHHVFVLIPKTQELKKHLDPIKSQTQSFNKAQLHFLKTCKILLGNTITPDLYHWAKAMKDNNHLGSVPYAIQITHYLEKTVLTTSMHQYLLEKQPHILDDFIHAAKDQLDLIRINAYYPLEIIPTLLQSLNQVLAKHAMWSIFIKRIEIANESVQPTIAPLHHLPKIIIYLNIAHAQHADFVDFIQSLKTIFLSFKGAEPNLNHSFKWLESVTITQGCQRYKPYLQALGLLDSVYSQETHYAFRKERDYTLLDNCFF